MIKIVKILLFIAFISSFESILAQEKIIIGYLPNYRFKVSRNIDFCKLTHLNICFANPDKKGNFSLTDTLQNVVDYVKLKNPDIKVFISIAGGALQKEQAQTWKKYIDNSKKRPEIIAKIIEFIDLYKFDGVDIDLEWRNVTKGYSPFILELRKALPKDMMLTAALPGTHRYSNITDEAIHTFDLINLMAYDEKGSWAPNQPGQHSSFEFAQKSIHFWKDSVGIPAHKLTLGLPFYAYDFTNPKKTKSFTIAEILRQNALNALIDSVGLIYYNGKPTLEKKVKLAATDLELAGVMIWELGQDTTGDISMLNTVHSQFKELKIKTTNEFCGLTEEEILVIKNEDFKKAIKVYANKKIFVIEAKNIAKLEVKVLNSKNKIQKIKIFKEPKKYTYKIKKLKKGTYTIQISEDELSLLKKLKLK